MPSTARSSARTNSAPFQVRSAAVEGRRSSLKHENNQGSLPVFRSAPISYSSSSAPAGRAVSRRPRVGVCGAAKDLDKATKLSARSVRAAGPARVRPPRLQPVNHPCREVIVHQGAPRSMDDASRWVAAGPSQVKPRSRHLFNALSAVSSLQQPAYGCASRPEQLRYFLLATAQAGSTPRKNMCGRFVSRLQCLPSCRTPLPGKTSINRADRPSSSAETSLFPLARLQRGVAASKTRRPQPEVTSPPAHSLPCIAAGCGGRKPFTVYNEDPGTATH